MRRHKDLFKHIYSFENLLSAFRKAAKGKRKNSTVATFELRMESNILELQEQLRTRTYFPGDYRAFTIYDPKERLISAAPFRDRVVHHALCNIIEPLFERGFIYDSYANRKGKGTHEAIRRYQDYAKQYRYVLKCDIRKFFPSIDHEVLKQELRRKIGCTDTCWLIDLILDNSNIQEEHVVYFPGDDLFTPHIRRRGLPIGNLTSQFWANVYMNRFDHWVKEALRAPGYIRYVDDFVLFSNDKEELHQWKEAIQYRLQELRLVLHPFKSEIHPTVSGVPFLGFRVFPHHRVVRKDSVRRYRRRLRKTVQERKYRQISATQLEHRLNSWLGHVRFGHSKRLEYNVYWYLIRNQVNLFSKRNEAWAVLEPD
jgi:RNA-directed DNA polymerase